MIKSVRLILLISNNNDYLNLKNEIWGTGGISKIIVKRINYTNCLQINGIKIDKSIIGQEIYRLCQPLHFLIFSLVFSARLAYWKGHPDKYMCKK